jgi:hypothetical protein
VTNLPPAGAPDYFALFQSMFAPPAAMGAPSAAAPNMFAMLDPKELEKKISELETVLSWLKATTGMVEMSIETMKYQQSVLTSFAAATAPKPAVADPTTTPPNMEDLAKMAGAMNPAMWALSMMQQAPAAKAGKQAPAATADIQAPAAPRAQRKKSKR